MFVLLVANPALAIEDCRDPTPDQRFQMDLCAAHKGCAIDIGLADACASLTRRIKAFFANKKPELDPGEYKSDRDAPLGPSELEQARKDNELYRQNRFLEERQASTAFNELTVLDRSLKGRIGQYCGTPMDSSCRSVVSEAESLKTRADSYNANKNFVDVRGVLTVESPALAAPYARMHAAFWDEQNKKADEERKRKSDADDARQKKIDDEARKKDFAGAESNQSGKLLPDGASNPAYAPDAGSVALPRRGGSSGSAMFQQAISQAEQDERDRPAREARERAENTRVAMAAASQTPEDRLRASFDQRIVTTRDRCSAAEGSCQKGCLGVVALGLLSLFSGSSAGASAASDQTQQCSNRCTQTKSSCDEQVAALEQEKLQAISEAKRGPELTASTNTAALGAGARGTASRASAGGRSCSDIVNGLVGPIYDGNPMAAAGSNLRYPLGQIYSDGIWAAQVFVRVANTHPACANDAESREGVAESLRTKQRYCREVEARKSKEDGPYDCVSGRSFGGTSARTEAAIQKLFQEAPSAGGAAAGAGRTSGECKAAYDRQEAENRPIARRLQSISSPVGQMQLLLGMLTRRITLLDQFCKGQPQYAEYSSTKQQYESTMRNCRAIATNSGDCVPR